MRKYNIPLKDTKEVKQEIVECSSGGNSGVKEYYYKIIKGSILEVCYNMVNQMYVLGSAICKLRVYESNHMYDCVKVDPFTIINNEIIAIHLIDMVDYLWNYTDYNGCYNLHIMSKGNIVDKLKYLAQEQGTPQEELQGMIDSMNSMFQEITKEEYEAMITYKP